MGPPACAVDGKTKPCDSSIQEVYHFCMQKLELLKVLPHTFDIWFMFNNNEKQ